MEIIEFAKEKQSNLIIDESFVDFARKEKSKLRIQVKKMEKRALPGWRLFMAKSAFIFLTILLLPFQMVSASVRDSTEFSYEFSGVFTWGEVVTALCRDGWCRTQLPREFFELSVPLNIYEKDFESAFKALSM